jgi:hypothetical protein
MRKSSFGFLLLALGLAACSIERTAKVNLEVPGEPALNWSAVKSVVLTGFFVAKEVKGLDLNKALIEYFRDALKPRLHAVVTEKPIAWPSAAGLESRDFWKGAAAGPDRTLILTGQAAFSQEARKALMDGERREIDEGPFKPISPWSEQKSFAVTLDLALIDPVSGAVVFRKEYKDAVSTGNARQTAEFALYDLMGRIQPRLFRALFGAERAQDRYLLLR